MGENRKLYVIFIEKKIKIRTRTKFETGTAEKKTLDQKLKDKLQPKVKWNSKKKALRPI